MTSAKPEIPRVRGLRNKIETLERRLEHLERRIGGASTRLDFDRREAEAIRAGIDCMRYVEMSRA